MSAVANLANAEAVADPRSTAEIQVEIDARRERSDALSKRIAELDALLDTTRDELGRAMAVGDGEPKVAAIRARLREAAEEREGAERGIEYLEAEAERLEARIAVVKVGEAADAFEGSRAEMDRRIEELRAKLQAWIEAEFQPLYEAAGTAAGRAQSDERSVRKLNGETNHWTRCGEDAWGARPGLWAIAQALAAYGEDPAGWAWKLPR